MRRIAIVLMLVVPPAFADDEAYGLRLSLRPPNVSLDTNFNDQFVAPTEDKLFVPPRIRDLPADAYGDMVRYGRLLFVDTQRYAKRFVGNGLTCANCHLSEGRKPGAAPLWAAYNIYPLYRGKNLRLNWYDERIGECFRFSLDGMSPTRDSPEMKALFAYSQWLSTNVAQRQIMAARGFPGASAKREPSPDRGKVIYEYQCAVCHGRNGEGVRRADGVGYQFPPVWGWNSYATGAGMNKLRTGAGFIKWNMPPGKGGSLTDQEATDVSFYLHIQDRPWDPRIGWFSIFISDLADG
jgi:thiosulfate dehydrogenase